MIRKILYWSLICALGALLWPSVSQAGKPRTGEVKDNKYTDTRFDFSVQLPDDWKIGKPKKEFTTQRLIAVQRNPQVPVKLRSDPSYAQKPTALIFCDSTDLAPMEYFHYLESDSGKSKGKEDILLKSVMLYRLSPYRMDVIKQLPAEVAGTKGVKLVGRIQYDAQVSLPGRNRIELVRDFRVGDVYLIPFDGWMMYIEFVCENDFYPQLEEVFDQIVSSITFGKSEEEEKKPEE
jgi:hypothetical protein